MTRRPDLPGSARWRRRIAPIAVMAAIVGASAGAPVASAAPAQQDPACTGGTVTAAVSAASLPGGRWSVTDGCILREAFYEVNLAEHRLVLALTALRWDDGHTGRLALATLTTPEDLAVSIVGVEDEATGFVRWVYAEGTHASDGGVTSFGGSGVTDVPDEPATLELTVTGTGTDLLTAENEVAEEMRTILFDAVDELTA